LIAINFSRYFSRVFRLYIYGIFCVYVLRSFFAFIFGAILSHSFSGSVLLPGCILCGGKGRCALHPVAHRAQLPRQRLLFQVCHGSARLHRNVMAPKHGRGCRGGRGNPGTVRLRWEGPMGDSNGDMELWGYEGISLRGLWIAVVCCQ
jgi:hypothetical protein